MLFYPIFKPAVLAIHGSASSSKQWRSLAAKIGTSATFVAPDLPGYGNAADDTRGRLAVLRDATAGRTARIHLVAHSFGGAVALKFANANPERIASVTLYDPIAAIGDVWGRPGLAPELDAIWHGFRDGSDGALMQAFLTFWGGDAAWDNLNKEQRIRLVAHASGLRRDMSEVASGQWTIDHSTYRGPLAILRGELSPAVTLGMARAIAKTHRQTVIKRLDGLGHLAPLTHPDVVNTWLCQSLSKHGIEITHQSNQNKPLAA